MALIPSGPKLALPCHPFMHFLACMKSILWKRWEFARVNSEAGLTLGYSVNIFSDSITITAHVAYLVCSTDLQMWIVLCPAIFNVFVMHQESEWSLIYVEDVDLVFWTKITASFLFHQGDLQLLHFY